MGDGIIQRYRDLIKGEMIEAGFKTHGFRNAVRKQFQKYLDEEWEEYIKTGDYEGEEKHEIDEPPCWPQPTAWRVVDKKDKHGRDWVTFECVDPLTSAMSENKAQRYAELWFYFDSMDQLIVLRLYRMDEYGKLYEVDLKGFFFRNSIGVEQMLGCVDNSIFVD